MESVPTVDDISPGIPEGERREREANELRLRHRTTSTCQSTSNTGVIAIYIDKDARTTENAQV